MLSNKVLLSLAVGLMVAVIACGSAASTNNQPELETPTSTPSDVIASGVESVQPTVIPTDGLVIDITRVPMVDTNISSVPLDEIVFDTFGRSFVRYVPLGRAEEDFILDLRDAIAPVYQPVYGGADDLPWLSDYDLVMGYVSGDKAFAYPINVLNLHELVNDEIDGVPVLISYCPLCVSGVVYNRELNGDVLIFGNTSALYQSDLVMYDHQTGSYWFQVGGEAVVGELTGSHLALLPSTTMAWKEWEALYPDTRLLVGTANSPTKFSSRRYGQGFSDGYQDRINEEEFVFPVDSDKLDRRLGSGDLVLTVEVGDAVSAYPLDRIGDAAVNDQVGGHPVVVFNREKSRVVGAFLRELEGRVLNFDLREETGEFIDRETGSVWDSTGRAVSGPLSGDELEHLNTRRAFWFSIVITFPNVDLYKPY